MFFEQAREQEEQKYKQNNQDVVVQIPSSSMPSYLYGLTWAYIDTYRELVLQHSRFKAEVVCLQALTRWGGALLELAHFRQGPEAYGMIQEVGCH